ncbi:hypothetical protein PMAYCL1PPCAC_02719, partial [Pristionchus mayeri]
LHSNGQSVMSPLPSPLIILLISSLLVSVITAQSDDEGYYREARAPKLVRFGRGGPKLVRFGKRSDPSMNTEEYDDMTAYKRGGPKVI